MKARSPRDKAYNFHREVIDAVLHKIEEASQNGKFELYYLIEKPVSIDEETAILSYLTEHGYRCDHKVDVTSSGNTSYLVVDWSYCSLYGTANGK